MRNRHIPLQGAANFRDLGGYNNRHGQRVRWRQVFRSDNLSDLASADWQQISELGIELVADMRNDAERERWPTTWPEHLSVDFLMRDYEMDLRQLGEVGYHILAYQQVDLLRGFFRTLAQSDGPTVLVHCTAGQDRTGFACALLLDLLEVPLETILEDYSLSHELRSHIEIDRDHAEELITFYGMDSSVEELIERRNMSVEERRREAEANMTEALERIATEHGSLTGFARNELHVDDDALQSIRQRLLS